MRAGIVAHIVPENWVPIARIPTVELRDFYKKNEDGYFSLVAREVLLPWSRDPGACSPRCPGCKQRTLERRVRPQTYEIYYACHNVGAHRDDPQCGYYQLPALLKSIQEDAAIAAGRSPSPR